MNQAIAENNKVDNEVLIRVKNASKKFCKKFKKSLWFGLVDLTREFWGLKKKNELRKDEFWAVNDVSFELRRGECLGLIGHNGAGKSTLLKILNGLIHPDRGEVYMKGQIRALIELGAGFNPILTGRENVFNYGIVLGFTHQEILNKYKDIVEFAEMEGFMETPVQNYSSGMKVRLGFAVAIQMNPDVLIIDEVLAVGDMNFKIKCFNALSELSKSTAIILVSHNVSHIARICNRLIYLEAGNQIDFHDDIEGGIDRYLKMKPTLKSNSDSIYQVEIVKKEIEMNDDKIDIKLNLKSLQENRCFSIELLITDDDQKPIASINSRSDNVLFSFDEQSYADVQMSILNVFDLGTFHFTLKVVYKDVDTSSSMDVFENFHIQIGRKNKDARKSKIGIPTQWLGKSLLNQSKNVNQS